MALKDALSRSKVLKILRFMLPADEYAWDVRERASRRANGFLALRKMMINLSKRSLRSMLV